MKKIVRNKLILVLCLVFGILTMGAVSPTVVEVTGPVNLSIKYELQEETASEESEEMPDSENEFFVVSDETQDVKATVISVPDVKSSEEIIIAPAYSAYCNGSYMGDFFYDSKGDALVCVQALISALDKRATTVLEEEHLVANIEGNSIEVLGSDYQYIVSNNRYIYLPTCPEYIDGSVYISAEALATCVGGSVSIDEEYEYLYFECEKIEGLQNGDEVYDSDDVYWLSHIIYSEAGIEIFDGQVAVGNVVLNRVESDAFPDDIVSVIFQSGQFDPVRYGSIYLTPSEEAVAAAKIALEGYNLVPGVNYFATTLINGNFICYEYIGNHIFQIPA